jgi:transcriptional regulator with XRE-family HTH domain
MMTHDEMIKKMLENPLIKAEYEALEEEFSFFDKLIEARHQSGMTQAEIAESMGTEIQTVIRLESGLKNRKKSPSVAMLQKYAEAVGCRLEIRLVRVQQMNC